MRSCSAVFGGLLFFLLFGVILIGPINNVDDISLVYMLVICIIMSCLISLVDLVEDILKVIKNKEE